METQSRLNSIPIVTSMLRRLRREPDHRRPAHEFHGHAQKPEGAVAVPVPEVPGAEMDERIEALFGHILGGKKHGPKREYWSTSPDRARALRLCIAQLPKSNRFRQRFEAELGTSRGPIPVCTAALKA